jgi:pre-mRNA-splicing helicase BRR2
VSKLNAIQTKVYETAFEKAENMLVCAPTGAGKTNVALLAMLQVIGRYINSRGEVDLSKFKIVYLAPMKALVAEMVLTFTKRLERK